MLQIQHCYIHEEWGCSADTFSAGCGWGSINLMRFSRNLWPCFSAYFFTQMSIHEIHRCIPITWRVSSSDSDNAWTNLDQSSVSSFSVAALDKPLSNQSNWNKIKIYINLVIKASPWTLYRCCIIAPKVESYDHDSANINDPPVLSLYLTQKVSNSTSKEGWFVQFSATNSYKMFRCSMSP